MLESDGGVPPPPQYGPEIKEPAESGGNKGLMQTAAALLKVFDGVTV